MSDTEMLRYNTGKPPVSLVPTVWFHALMSIEEDGSNYEDLPNLLTEETAQVLGFGAQKYSANNWRKGSQWTSVADCAFRHLDKIFRGETHDVESGLHHAAHAACNIAFLLEFVEQGIGIDDRYHLPVMYAPKFYNEGDELSLAYHHLLRWKDGEDVFGSEGETNLAYAAYFLALWFEMLDDDERAPVPGTSPYALIQESVH